MKVLGHRFCMVAPAANSHAFARSLLALGMDAREIFTSGANPGDAGFDDDDFKGAIFETDQNSWVELWSEVEGTPSGVMLQLIVDDADAFAENAKKNGLAPQGPVDAHGERIYFLPVPGGIAISFQSKTAH